MSEPLRRRSLILAARSGLEVVVWVLLIRIRCGLGGMGGGFLEDYEMLVARLEAGNGGPTGDLCFSERIEPFSLIEGSTSEDGIVFTILFACACKLRLC